MLIYANPSTRPKKATTATKARKPRAVKKGASAMAKKHRSAAQKAATRRMLAANNSRKRYRNPAPRKATRSRRRYANPAPRHHRRRVHRNPGSFTKGILGELASMDGLMLLGTAALAPTVVDMAAAAIVPVQYQSGWTGLLAKAALAAAGAYAIDRFTGKRKAAVGFAVGAGGSLIALAYRTFQAQNALPAAVTSASPATADEIARNPTLYRSLMDGNDWSSLNEYTQAPSMNGYVAAPMSDEWESLN